MRSSVILAVPAFAIAVIAQTGNTFTATSSPVVAGAPTNSTLVVMPSTVGTGGAAGSTGFLGSSGINGTFTSSSPKASKTSGSGASSSGSASGSGTTSSSGSSSTSSGTSGAAILEPFMGLGLAGVFFAALL